MAATAPCCPQPTKPRRNLGLEFLTSSLGVATATTITQPIDLVKTRMQLELLREQGASTAGTAASRPSSSSGLFATASGVVRREGVLALWGGAAPAAIRGMSYGGLRLGLYGPIRDALAAVQAGSGASSSSSTQNASFGIKLASGAASGALAAAITSPTELVKVRMQALPATAVVAAAAKPTATTTTAPAMTAPRPPQPPPRPPVSHHNINHNPMPAGLAGMSCSASSSSSSSSSGMRALSSASTAPAQQQPPSSSSLSRLSLIVRQVVQEDGVRGLWRGATPGMIRAAVLTASQCATYDSAKRHLAALTGLPDESLVLQTGCALLTGLASTTATQPVDVIKTHMFVTRRGATGAGGSNTNTKNNGVVATAKHIYQLHGARGFLRGWTANYARLGPMTVLIFTTTELLRKQLGMGAL
jgi:solute carrier family 25 uncoupling protein 8/9